MLIVVQPLQGDLGMEREAGQRIAQLVSRNRQEFIPHVQCGFRVQAGLVLGG